MNQFDNQIDYYIDLIENELSAEHAPRWGQMKAQDMVEHMSLNFLLSTGIEGKEFTGDPERAAKQKAIFFSVKYPFPKGVKIPGQEKGAAPPPLQFASLDEAILDLKKSHRIFLDHFQKYPEEKIQHPYFGILSYEEWAHFHTKHFAHHSMQFGLEQEPLTPEMEILLDQIKENLKVVYQQLSSDHKARWGLMNAHQCVEHLSMVFVYSTGKFDIPFRGDEAAAKKMWEPFKAAERPWKTVFPQTRFTKEPPKLRTADIEAAKKALKKSFIKYTHYCKENPEAITPHGFLGNISTCQWLLVHKKHIEHHLDQFGLI